MPQRPIVLCAILTLSAASCFNSRRFRTESCLRGELGTSCFASIDELTEGEPPEAGVAMFRRFASAQLARCDATYLRPRDEETFAPSENADLCQAFAAMRLGARVPLAPHESARVAALQARAEPLVAQDFEKGMRTLEALCEPGDRGHALSCARLALLARAEERPVADWYFRRACEPLGWGRDDTYEVCRARLEARPDFAGWPDATVRAVVARGLIARAESAPTEDPSARTRMLLAAQTLLASSASGEERALGAQLTGRVRGSAREEFDALRATVERQAPTNRPLDAAVYSLERMREAIPRMEESEREAAQSQLAQTVDNLARAESAAFASRNWFGRALEVFDAADRLGGGSAERAQMRAELQRRAIAFHRERAERNAAAGRFLAARLHAGRVRQLGGRFELDPIDQRVRESVGSGRALRYDPSQCPWAAAGIGPATPEPTSPGAMVVSIQWTRCAASERQWQAHETVQVEESYETTEEVTETRTVTEQQCTDSYSTTTVHHSSGSTSVPVTRRTCSPTTRTVTTRVPRTVRRTRLVPTPAEVSHREIAFALAGSVTVSRWGATITEAFDYSHAPVSEVAYTARSETRRFTDLSLDALRRDGVARLAGSALSEPIRRLADQQADALEAEGYGADDDDTREERYVRAHYASPTRESRVIETYLANRYGMDMEALAQALTAR